MVPLQRNHNSEAPFKGTCRDAESVATRGSRLCLASPPNMSHLVDRQVVRHHGGVCRWLMNADRRAPPDGADVWRPLLDLLFLLYAERLMSHTWKTAAVTASKVFFLFLWVCLCWEHQRCLWMLISKLSFSSSPSTIYKKKKTCKVTHNKQGRRAELFSIQQMHSNVSALPLSPSWGI